MSTLIGFLLARLAEDELAVPTIDCPCGETPTHPLPHCGARIIADCEAKRQIVAAELLREVGPLSHYVTPEVHAQISARTVTPVLRLLAGIYRDHPDYREEWR